MNRAWTFIINKQLSPEQLAAMKEAGNSFVQGWTAHEQKLSGGFDIFNDRIIIFKVNEEATAASGCSIDKLTRFIKQLETDFGIELMNRLLVAYKKDGKTEVAHSSNIKNLLADGELTENTPVYNTAISNQDELSNWEQPLKNTWLKKYL
ncbi:MAG: hypothetical protein H0W61_03880 [Bacteroidetes bacterium]|nr:hypothetical protein [Bacteroidota bacterium]